MLSRLAPELQILTVANSPSRSQRAESTKSSLTEAFSNGIAALAYLATTRL
jgi:hypothetical protein